MNADDRGIVDELQLRADSTPATSRDLSGVDAARVAGNDQGGRRPRRGSRPRPAAARSERPGDHHGVSVDRGNPLEHAQQIVGHASPETAKPYDRTVDEIERIVDLNGTARTWRRRPLSTSPPWRPGRPVPGILPLGGASNMGWALQRAR